MTTTDTELNFVVFRYANLLLMLAEIENELNGPDNASVDIQGGAVAIGGQVRYVFPGNAPLAVLGEIFYAPEVTSISEFNRLLEYRVALELEVTPSARAYIGYRMMEVKFDTAGTSVNYEVDDSANIGVRFEF